MTPRQGLASFAAAALIGGGLLVSGAPTVQAQAMTCATVLGATAACSESYFNKDTGPASDTVIVTESGRALWPANMTVRVQPQVAAQPQATSQAGPQPEAQSEGQE